MPSSYRMLFEDGIIFRWYHLPDPVADLSTLVGVSVTLASSEVWGCAYELMLVASRYGNSARGHRLALAAGRTHLSNHMF